MADLIIRRLPVGQGVVDLVGENLREHWLARKEHYNGVIPGLLLVQEVKDAILEWWGVLVATLLENTHHLPPSARALEYEKTRRNKCFEKQHEFRSEPTIVAKAEELGVETRRVAHCLTCVFLAIDDVSLPRMVGIWIPEWNMGAGILRM